MFLLFAFAFLLYGNTINHEYNFDDALVTQNHRHTSRGVEAIPEIFTSHYYQDEDGYAYEYRPVTLASFAIEHQFFGESPTISHFINVLLYAISGVLLFVLLSSLLPGQGIHFCFLVAFIFIAHPLHTEVVASIKNRDEILALLFAMLSWVFAIKFIHRGYLFLLFPSLIFLVMGILSKMSVVVFVVLIPLSAVFFENVKYKRVFILSFLFAVASVFFIPENAKHLKFLFFLVSAFVPLTITYLLKSGFVESAYHRTYDFLYTKDRPVNDRLKAFCGWFKKVFETNTIAIIALLAMLYVTGLLLNNDIAVLIAVNASFIFMALSVADRKRYFLVLLSLMLIVTFWFAATDIVAKSSVYAVVLLFVAGYIPKEKLNIASIIVLTIAAAFFVHYSITPLILMLLVSVIASRNRALLFTSFLYFIYLVFRFFLGKYDSAIDYIFLVIASIIPLLLMREKLGKTGQVLLLCAFIGFTVAGIYNYRLIQSDANLSLSEPLAEMIEMTTPEVLEYTDRPLGYLESPLDKDASWNTKIGTSAYVLGEYLKKMLVPISMGFYYGYAHIVPVGTGNMQSLISLVLHLALMLAAIILLRRHLVLSYGIVFYLVSILLFSNLFYPVVGMMGDRLTYVASIGFSISLVYLLTWIFKIKPGKNSNIRVQYALVYMFILIISVYSVKTVARNNLWQDPLTLMEHDIKYLDKSAQAHNMLASYYLREYNENKNSLDNQRYLDQAIKHYNSAIEIYPDFFNAHYDLGKAYNHKKEYKKAVKSFKRVIELDSTYTNAMISIANIYEVNDLLKYSIPYYEMAISNSSDNLLYYNSLAYAWYRLGEYNKAIEVGKQAVKAYPNEFDPWSNLGKIYIKTGNNEQAIICFEKALRISNHSKEVSDILSELYREQEGIEKTIHN